MKITGSNLTHWAGLSAIVAGIMYVIVGLSHTFVSHYGGLASVTNDVWVLTHSLTIGVSFFGLLGIAGIYATQVEKAGWFGLAGFLLLSLWLVLVPGFTFFEALILPLLAVDAPNVAEGFLGIFTGSAGATSFGTLTTVWANGGNVHPRRPAIRHRDSARRDPIALGGWPVRLRSLVLSRVRANSARARAASGGAGGIRSGMARIFALVRTARARCATRTCQGARTAPRNPSHVSSLELHGMYKRPYGRLSHCVARSSVKP